MKQFSNWKHFQSGHNRYRWVFLCSDFFNALKLLIGWQRDFLSSSQQFQSS